MQGLEDRLKELGDRVLQQVPSELRPTPRALRRIRVGRAVRSGAVVAAVAALVIGGFAATDLLAERSSIQPADRDASPSEPTPSETPENAEGSGRRYNILDGEVTFRAAKPWEPNVESVLNAEGSLPSEFSLITRFDETETTCASVRASCAAFVALADPAPRQESCEKTGGTVVSAEALANAIGANPRLESTEPFSERVAGIDALRLDVAPVQGAATCGGSGEGIGHGDGVPVLTHTRHMKLGPPIVPVVEPGKRMRVYLLDLPEGAAARTLAIMIVATEADFDVAVEAARPILESFEFQEAQQKTGQIGPSG